MVRRNLGLPHRLISKNFNCVIWVKVNVLLDDKVVYRSSLANMGGDCHRLGLTQAIRKELGKTFGDIVEVKRISTKTCV